MKRLGDILIETKTPCYAWALIPNHFHLLLKTGTVPLSSIMRRLLTGYAVSFNLKHRHQGHLFQNRYKSILCQEDAYLMELVRYIHLNPLRAGLVKDYEAISKYRYCGHGTVLGYRKEEWQDVEYVLRFFGTETGAARRRYRRYVKEGIELGRRADLVGGGLLRSQGGWIGVKALREAESYQKGDERILGEGAFVEQTLAEAEERFERKYRLVAKGYNLTRVAERVAELFSLSPEQVLEPGRVRGKDRVKARSLMCYWATTELGISQNELAETLHLTQAAISVAVKRANELIRKYGYTLEA